LLNNDDLNPNSNKTIETINKLETIQNKIKKCYNCNKIGMTIITFEENTNYDDKNITYTTEKINDKVDINKVIIKCNNVTNVNWLHILENNSDTVYKLYCDLHTL